MQTNWFHEVRSHGSNFVYVVFEKSQSTQFSQPCVCALSFFVPLLNLQFRARKTTKRNCNHMPQQLSLYGSIHDADLKITLHTLVALTGMEPRPIFSHNLIWIPKHPFRPVLAAGQVNQIEQYRICLHSDLVAYTRSQTKTSPGLNESRINAQFQHVEGLVAPFTSERAALSSRNWINQVAELPEAGKRKVISQSLLSAQVTTGDPFGFLENLGYTFSSEYWIKGYQFIYGKVVLELFRLCGYDEATKTLKLLDESGRWAVKAYTNVSTVTDIDAITIGTQMLERLKTEVAGLIDLEQPDRNCFDTRIKKMKA